MTLKRGNGGASLTPQQEAGLAANTAARHEHANKAILDGTTGTFTLARQEKLDGVQDTFKGTFLNATAIETAWPTPLDGWAVWNADTATVWSAAGGVWADTLATSVGDMLKATYDPQGISRDAFSMDNMAEGANTKILTSAERISIADIPNKQAVISATNRLPVNLVGDGNKVLSENDFTASLANKLANIEDRFLGIFADAAARDLAYPTPLNGQYCKQSDTSSFWFYGAGVWTDTGSSSTGDMLASLYDPQGVAGDAFNLDNMVDSVNFVKMTADERVKLANSSQLTTAERLLIPTQADADKLDALPTRAALTSEIGAKQTKLVSGSTIRTINGSTLLGSGNLAISTNITGVAYNSSTDKVVISKNMDINMFVVFDDPGSSSKMTVTWENDTTTPSKRNLVFTPTNNALVEMTDLYVRGSIDTGNLYATGDVSVAGLFKSLGANIGFKNASNAGWYSSGSGGFRPYSNGTQDIGQSSLRVRTIYTVNSVNVSSDERYKHFGEEVDHKLLRNLSGKHYTWKAGSPSEYQEDIGFSAQEVAKVLPELVNYDVASDFYSMSYERLVVPLVNYCNAQQDELDNLKARLDKLTEVKEKKKRWYYLWLI